MDQACGGLDFHRWPLWARGGQSLFWEGVNKANKSVETNSDFSDANPMRSNVAHPGGLYLTPGAGATMPPSARQPPAKCMRLGKDTGEVLSGILRLSSNEVGRLHDSGVVASAAPG